MRRILIRGGCTEIKYHRNPAFSKKEKKMKREYILMFISVILLSAYESGSSHEHWTHGTWSVDKVKSLETFRQIQMDISPEHKNWIVNMIKTSDEKLTIDKDKMVLHYTDQPEQTHEYEVLKSSDDKRVIRVQDHRLKLGRDSNGVFRDSPAVAKVRNSQGEYEERQFDLRLYMKKD